MNNYSLDTRIESDNKIEPDNKYCSNCKSIQNKLSIVHTNQYLERKANFPVKALYIDESERLEVKKIEYKAKIEAHKIEYKKKKIESRKLKYNNPESPMSFIYSTISRIKDAYRETIDDIIFVKKSLGKDGKEINIYKLQTMVPGTDYMFNEIAETFGLDEKGNLKYDPRITNLGRIARKFWLDELPQIVNWIKGEIKFTGIRPMGEKHWKQYPFKEKALKQKPGLLGINYAVPRGYTKEETFKFMERYLNKCEKDLAGTDIKYLKRVAYNIVVNRVRSS